MLQTVVRFAWYVERAKVKEMENAARLLSVDHVRREPLDVAGTQIN